MKLMREIGGEGPLISGFARGGFRIDDKVFTALCITPRRVEGWDPPALSVLDETALGLALALDPAPEFILLGTGTTLALPPSALADALEGRGIGIEAMDSRAAARAWSVLRREGRWIAGAFYPL